MVPEQPLQGGCIVVLTRDSSSGRAVANAVAADSAADGGTGREVVVVVEPHPSTVGMLRRRIRRLGLPTVIGQVLFLALAAPILRSQGRRRVAEIVADHDLRIEAFTMPVRHVPSVNDPSVSSLLREARPAVVVVTGTRILDRTTLASTEAPFLNLHAGITPAYRGAHGGYWALVDGAPALVGTTIHLIDPGIDTGPVVDQVPFAVTASDTFATYPYLHVAAGLPSLIAATRMAIAGEVRRMADPPNLPSRLRSHPTIWSYVWNRLRHGVR